jgi:hypothetical protein
MIWCDTGQVAHYKECVSTPGQSHVYGVDGVTWSHSMKGQEMLQVIWYEVSTSDVMYSSIS